MQAQSLQIAKVLLEHGADSVARNKEGITPVMYAIEKVGAAQSI